MLREHVYDRTGARYQLQCDSTKTGGVIRLSKVNMRVGFAIYTVAESWVRLVDLKVFGPTGVNPEPEVPEISARSIPNEGFHGRGLGTVLLQCVSEAAGEAGCAGVVGFIAPRHLTATPFLLRWFASNGYIVAELKDNKEWAAKVSLPLGQDELP